MVPGAIRCVVALAVLVTALSFASPAMAGDGEVPTVTGSSACTTEGTQLITWVFAAQATGAPRYVGPGEISGAAEGQVAFGMMITPQTELTGTATVDGDVVGQVDIVVPWRFGVGAVASTTGSVELFGGCIATVGSVDPAPTTTAPRGVNTASPRFTG
jgi:hypothetical protein